MYVWTSKFLGIWAFGHLGFWASGHLGIWASGLLGIWASGLLGIWASELLGFWPFGLLSVHQSRTNLYNYNRHKQRAHPDHDLVTSDRIFQKKLLECEDCDYKTWAQDDFNAHLIKHNQCREKDVFRCDFPGCPYRLIS